MEYKRLNKVKIIKNNGEKKFDKCIGKQATILGCMGYKDYILDIEGGTWWTTDEFELATTQFTKSDLKDNHIVVDNYGGKRLWGKIDQKYINQNLKSGLGKIFDIMEVWEFDKLVWKREEQVLDEVEELNKKLLEENKEAEKEEAKTTKKEDKKEDEPKNDKQYIKKTYLISQDNIDLIEGLALYTGKERKEVVEDLLKKAINLIDPIIIEKALKEVKKNNKEVIKKEIFRNELKKEEVAMF